MTKLVRVSKQFERITTNVFRKKYGKLYLSDHFYSINTEWFDKVFIHFGYLIKEFTTKSQYYPWFSKFTQKRIVKLIRRYCTREEGSLKILRLGYFTDMDNHLTLLYRTFKNLSVLELTHVRMPCTIGYLLNIIENANEITISYGMPSTNILQSTDEILPSLNLRKLHLNCGHPMNMNQILCEVDSKYPNLVDLRFDPHSADETGTFRTNLYRMSRLKNLRALEVSLMFLEPCLIIDEIINNNVQLKSLKMDFIPITERSAMS